MTTQLPLIKIYERADLVKTSDYPHAKFPFSKFNPIQSALIDVYDKDANCIVAASTSAGKTGCAEMFMAHEVRVRGNKTIYLSPLKALSQEKLNDWLGEHHFADLKVAICTGDYRITQGRIKELNEADVIIITSEMLNSISRNHKADKNQFLHHVGLLVADECLTPDTLIETDKGLIAIGEIIDENLNVKVASFNHQKQKIEYKKILSKTKKYKKRKWLTIYYNNTYLSMTSEHLVWCHEKGYIPSKLLMVGDTIYVSRTNTKRKANYTRDVIGGCFNSNSAQSEISQNADQPIRETKEFDRVEIRRIEEIGWNPSEDGKERRLWKNVLSVQYPFLQSIIRNLSSNISEWEETSERKMAQGNQRPNSTSRLVYGRWKSSQKQNVDAYGRISQGASGIVGEMDESILGCGMPSIQIQRILEDSFFGNREGPLSEFDKGRSNTGILLQNGSKTGKDILLDVRNIVRNRSSTVFRKEKNFALWLRRVFQKVTRHNEQDMDMAQASICCDLEIEDNNNFFANGVLVHNCHTIGTKGRGDHLESGIMKFTEANDKARILMLSATMPNVDEVGRWLHYLTGRSTYLLESDYRPCKLNIHYEQYWDDAFNYEDNERKKVYLAAQLLKKHPKDKFICFVHTKKTGEMLADYLGNIGIEYEYHNANLDKDKRVAIEKRFREDPKLRVVVATSGLAQGLNLPARRVVVLGVHRGLTEVESHEIIQAAGRAGRPKYDTEGDAYILLPRKKFEYHKERLEKKVYIQSQMTDPKVLAFHLVSEIHHGGIRSTGDVRRWYNRTLAHFQKHSLDEEVVEQVIKNLLLSGCIKEEDNGFRTTALGTIASMFYYSPFDVADLSKNFTRLFKDGKADRETWLAMALGNIESHRMGIVNTAEREEMNEFFAEVQGSKIEKTLSPKAAFTSGALKAGYCYLQLLSGATSKNLNNIMRVLQMDFGRTGEVLTALDTMTGKWDQNQFFKELGLRMAYGVTPELVGLCILKGIGRAKAKRLYTAGLRDLKDINDVPKVIKALGCSKKAAEELVAEARSLAPKPPKDDEPLSV